LAFPGASRTSLKRFEKTTACPVVRRSGDTHAPESASRDASLSSLPGLHQAPLMGFPKNAPPSDSALVVHSCLDSFGFHLGFLGFGPPLPGGESRSVFVVFHHLGGLLHRESRGFVAPRSRSWGSPRWGWCQSHRGDSNILLSATPNPSKSLHARSFSTAPFQDDGSPGFLPSCRSPFGDGSASGLSSAVGFVRRLSVSTLRPTQLPWVSPSNSSGWPYSGSHSTRRSADSRRGDEARRAEQVRLLLSRAASRRWELFLVSIESTSNEGALLPRFQPGPPWWDSTSMKEGSGGSCLAVLVLPHREGAGDSDDGDGTGAVRATQGHA